MPFKKKPKPAAITEETRPIVRLPPLEMFQEEGKGMGVRVTTDSPPLAFRAGQTVCYYPGDVIVFPGGLKAAFHPGEDVRPEYETEACFAKIGADGQYMLIQSCVMNVIKPLERISLFGQKNMFGPYINDCFTPDMDTEAKYLAAAAKESNVVMLATGQEGERVKYPILFKLDHEGEPSLLTEDDEFGGSESVQPILKIVALRDLGPGEALSLSYGWPYWRR